MTTTKSYRVDDDAPIGRDAASMFAARVQSQCDDIAAMLIAKNAAYGNSALDPIRVFSRSPADEQIRVRIDDKLSRLARGERAGEDTILDLIGYLILLRMILSKGPTDANDANP
jgi:hypothetical protein